MPARRAASSLLHLEAVSKGYGSRTILHAVSCILLPGTLTLVAGPNGSGKSTLLRVMAGLSRPDSGTVAFDGSSGGMAYLGHETLLYPHLTALENLAFWAALHGMPTDDEALLDTLDRMRLAAFADERAGSFSRGMAQRLSLARALSLCPSCLLLDEPLTGMDAASAKLVRETVPQLKEQGTALVWVTHDPHTDGAMADAVLTLDGDGGYAFTAAPFTGIVPARHSGQHFGQPELSFFPAALAIAAKDIKLLAGRGGALLQALLLGLLLIVLFGLGLGGSADAARIGPTAAAAVFWLASAFCQTILMTALFGLEETNKARIGLLLSPVPSQAVWLGKAIAGTLLLLAIQAVFLIASVVFLGQPWAGNIPLALAAVPLVDIGMASLGALLGSIARGHTARESLCSLVVFPLLIPVLLAGIRALSALYAPESAADAARWLGFAAAFDAVFAAAALFLFPVMFGGDD